MFEGLPCEHFRAILADPPWHYETWSAVNTGEGDVPYGTIEPRREHSRKPDCVYERIERLVAGPYLELFARTRRPGWTSWGNEVDKFTSPVEYNANDDMQRSLEDCYAAVRARKAAGGKGWPDGT